MHIGLFGRRNAGKSSLINALTGQDLAIVSQTPGTTADPVYKSMELHPVGPVVFIDTAGYDDEGELGALRVAKAGQVIEQTDLAILVLDGVELAAEYWNMGKAGSDAPEEEKEGRAEGSPGPGEITPDPDLPDRQWAGKLHAARIPVITVINKWEQLNESGRTIAMEAAKRIAGARRSEEDAAATQPVIPVSAKTGEGIEDLCRAVAEIMPEDQMREQIVGGLVSENDLVLLVMPQDIQAPKGRLILPQVQTIRELLDRRCTVVMATADGLERALDSMKRPPDLIITDSQVFGEVYEKKPETSKLTSFSILMAASKGDITTFIEGASAIDDALRSALGSGRDEAPFRVLIAEACTHVPLNEDIGSVKIPRLLKQRLGDRAVITSVRGKDFPDAEELKQYDLIIHCGACMFNRSLVMHRVRMAREAGVPITNYGVFLAKMSGILDKVVF